MLFALPQHDVEVGGISQAILGFEAPILVAVLDDDDDTQLVGQLVALVGQLIALHCCAQVLHVAGTQVLQLVVLVCQLVEQLFVLHCCAQVLHEGCQVLLDAHIPFQQLGAALQRIHLSEKILHSVAEVEQKQSIGKSCHLVRLDRSFQSWDG